MLNNPDRRLWVYIASLAIALLTLFTDVSSVLHWIPAEAVQPIKDDLGKLLPIVMALGSGTAAFYLNRQRKTNTLALSGPIEDQAVTAVQATVAQAQAGQAGLQKLIEALSPLIAPAPTLAPTPAVAPLYPPSTWNGTQPPITVGDAAP